MKEVRSEVKELTKAIERLAYEIHRTRENDTHEREKMALRLEVQLLRFERRLPAAGQANSPDDTRTQ